MLASPYLHAPQRNRHLVCSCVFRYHLVVSTLVQLSLRHTYPFLSIFAHPSRMCLLRLLTLENVLWHDRHLIRRSVERAVSGDEKSVEMKEEPLVSSISPMLPDCVVSFDPYLGLLIDAATVKLADGIPAGFNDRRREFR